jgi:outer membrane lipoprotein SlyB
MRKLSQLAILALIPLGLFAARLTLRDGTTVTGRFVSGSEDRIVFLDDRGIRRTFNTNEIQTLDFNDTMAPAGGAYNRDNDRRDNAANRADDRHRTWATLPAGTPVSVRTDETINADTASQGRTYSASIYQDVLDSSGNVVIPRGSRATLVVRRVSEGGTVTSGNLALDLDSVEVNGRRYNVSTEDIEKRGSQGIGANRRTGEMVGGGAVLGTLLGAIAGGGKGAAIGAIAGAAAGGGVQVLTKGKEIRVPAETVLNFRLDRPLTLREA